MIRPGSTSLTDQPGDRPQLPSEKGISQQGAILGTNQRDEKLESVFATNENSPVRDGEEEVPARDHDQDDKLGSEEQSELHNVSIREAERGSHENSDGRPSA